VTLFSARAEGALPGGERWSIGWHFTGAADLVAALNAASLVIGTIWTGGTSAAPGVELHYTPSTTVSSVVVYIIDPVTHHATKKLENALSLVGGGTGSPLPQETAVVATLRTDGVGPSARGRIFMPAPVVGDVLATGRFDSVAAGDFASSIAAGLGTLLTTDYLPVLSSPGRADRELTSVDVGDVFDVHRSRRDKLVEERVSYNIVAT